MYASEIDRLGTTSVNGRIPVGRHQMGFSSPTLEPALVFAFLVVTKPKSLRCGYVPDPTLGA